MMENMVTFRIREIYYCKNFKRKHKQIKSETLMKINRNK